MKKKCFIGFLIALVILSVIVIFLINNNKKRSDLILVSRFKISSFGPTNVESDYSKIMEDILMNENNIERMKLYLKNVYSIENPNIDFEIKNISREENEYKIYYDCQYLSKDECYSAYKYFIADFANKLDRNFELGIIDLNYQYEIK